MTNLDTSERKMAGSSREAIPPGNKSIRWPDEDLFLLRELSVLKKVHILKGEWLGVYQDMLYGLSQGSPTQVLLYVSRSPAVLYRKLKDMAITLPLIVRRASSRDQLPREVEPAKPDRFTQLSRSAYEAVAHARQLLDPDGFLLPSVTRLKSYGWFVYELMTIERVIVQSEAKSLDEALGQLCRVLFKIEDRARNWNVIPLSEYSVFSTEFAEALGSEKEKGKFRVANAQAQDKIDRFLADSEAAVLERFKQMRRAAEFLRTLANMARRKGGNVGDCSTSNETRAVLTALHALAQGEPLKAIAQVATNGQVDDAKSLKKYKSLERMISRFSKRVARAVQVQYGPKIVSLDYKHLIYALQDWAWIDLRRDRLALMEAARRGLPHLRLS
jgi:hypothetical protein